MYFHWAQFDAFSLVYLYVQKIISKINKTLTHIKLFLPVLFFFPFKLKDVIFLATLGTYLLHIWSVKCLLAVVLTDNASTNDIWGVSKKLNSFSWDLIVNNFRHQEVIDYLPMWNNWAIAKGDSASLWVFLLNDG